VKEAQANEDPQAGSKTADEGLNVIVAAEEAARDSRTILNDALQKRARAQAVHAHLLYENEFNALEKELSDVARAIANGNKKLGLEKNTDLAAKYGKLEVTALKANISEIAERAYQEAEESRAQRYAPKTLKAAKNELDIARKIIDVEKENFDKAQYHAEQARYLAIRAKFIAELVMSMKKERMSEEQFILWYQSQLETAHSGLPTPIYFDASNADVLERFAAELRRLSGDLNQLETKTLAKEEHFREVSALFTADEAEVVRRGDDLIIRSYGFYFPIGKSDLLSRNFELLNKIIVAINRFPNAELVVEGHTDSTGFETN
jgi:OOP family OmpA-OmpF porin